MKKIPTFKQFMEEENPSYCDSIINYFNDPKGTAKIYFMIEVAKIIYGAKIDN